MRRLLSLLVVGALAAAPGAAFAWGGTGHRMAARAAMQALPAEVPGFLRTPQAVAELGELSREPDRWKASGKIHDSDRDAEHFVDIDDAGRILGGPAFLPLPATKSDYAKALNDAGVGLADAGYLQFALIDRFQQLTADFAYWRILEAAEKNPAWRKNLPWFRADRQRREALLLHNLGELAHFVADASQPMHTSVHYNGWGDYPNPQGLSSARLHSLFEVDLVKSGVRPEAIAAQMTPLRLCQCAIEERAPTYILASNAQILPFFELEKAGGMARGDPRMPAFAVRQLAVGASELRDLIVEAWRASATRSVGWRPVAVQDVLSGKTDPYPSLYGVD